MSTIKSWTPIYITIGSACGYILVTSLIHQPGSSLCRYDYEYAEWTQYALMAAIGAFAFSCLIQLRRLVFIMFSGSHDTTFYIILSTLLINILGGMSVALERIEHNLCHDNFGVVTYAANWCSWTITVPLLMYTVLVPEFGKAPTPTDVKAIVTIFLTIVFGFAMQFNGLQLFGTVIFFILSCVTFTLALYFMYVSNAESKELYSELVNANSNLCGEEKFRLDLKLDLSVTFAVVMCFFPLVYILAMIGALNPSTTLMSYLVLDVAAKGFVAFTAMDSHLSLLYSVKADLALQVKANARKRAFIRYMFHETRIPLNAIAMGVDFFVSSAGNALSKSEGNDAVSAKESLDTIVAATDYLEEALNSYLTMQQVEEGTFDIDCEEVNLKKLWAEIVDDVSKNLDKRNLQVLQKSGDQLPESIFADRRQLMYALKSLLFCVASRSHPGSAVQVTTSTTIKESVKSGPRGGTQGIYSVELSFDSSGCIISTEDQRHLFEAYGTLFTGDMLGQYGSGLSPVIAKEIISLHNGTVHVSTSSSGGLVCTVRMNLRSAGKDMLLEKPSKRRAPHYLDLSKLRSVRVSARVGIASPSSPTASTTSYHLGQSFSNREGSEKLKTSANNGQTSSSPHHKYTSISQSEPNHSVNVADESTITHHQPSMGTGVEMVEWDKRDLPDVSDLRVLCVDDTPSNTRMLQWLLKQFSVSSIAATNGLEATLLYQENPSLHIIFMDYTMPVVNGIEATRIIRNKGFLGCIVAVTGNAMDDDVQEFLDVGADAVVTKPMKRNKLEAILACFVMSRTLGEARHNLRSLQH